MDNFKCIRIDSISSINLDELKREDLRPHYGTGVAVKIDGSRREKDWYYRTGIQTNLGDIEISVWIELAERLIKKENGEKLFAWISEWVKDTNTVKSYTAKDLYKEALEDYMMSLPDDKKWCDYIPFNRKYRPELLEDPALIAVITECCNTPCKAVPEQIREYHTDDPCIPCPTCGKLSKFKILKKEDNS